MPTATVIAGANFDAPVLNTISVPLNQSPAITPGFAAI